MRLLEVQLTAQLIGCAGVQYVQLTLCPSQHLSPEVLPAECKGQGLPGTSNKDLWGSGTSFWLSSLTALSLASFPKKQTRSSVTCMFWVQFEFGPAGFRGVQSVLGIFAYSASNPSGQGVWFYLGCWDLLLWGQVQAAGV